MKTLTIANQKGGAGKTTLTAHLAFAAQQAKKRVLLIDADPQGSLSLIFNTAVADPAMLATSDLFSTTTDKPLCKIDRYLSLVPADETLFDLLSSPVSTLERLRENLKQFSGRFDLCLIDTPPERNSLLIGALAAADFVITPMTIGLLEQSGVRRLFDSIEGTRGALNPRLQHLGILLMKTNSRSSKERAMIEELRSLYGARILNTSLPERAAVRNSINSRCAVWTNPRGTTHQAAAAEWRSACSDILASLN